MTRIEGVRLKSGRGFRQPFWILVFSALTLKLWLTATIAINAIYGPHDATNFLEHAKFVLAGRWFGPYSDFTLIKGPTTPLYVALIRELGISLPLAHQLIYAGAALLLCVAIRPLVRSGWSLGLLFWFVLFNPITFDSNAWTLNRSQVIDTLSLSAVVLSAGVFIRADRSVFKIALWMAALGGALIAVVMTREDTVWIFPPVAVFLGAYAFRVWKFEDSKIVRLALIALVPAIFACSLETIMTINESVYGWRTAVETTSPEFTSAYQSFTRVIVPGVDERAYNAPRAAREMIYRVSPAAAEFRPVYDLGQHYQNYACESVPGCHDVTAPWTIWAFRDSVQLTGHYATGTDARDFYVRLSREIDAACNDGRLRCRAKSFGLSPPVRWSDFPATLGWAAVAFRHGLTLDQFVLGSPAVMTSQDVAIQPDYESVAGSSGSRLASYQGWLVHRGNGHVRLDAPDNQDYFDVHFGPSPDVKAAVLPQREYRYDDANNARFDITTSCFSTCFLVVDDGPGRTARIPLTAETANFHAPGILYHVDATSIQPALNVSDAFRDSVLDNIAIAYQQLLVPGFLFVIFAIVARTYRIVRGRRSPQTVMSLVVTLGVATAILAHCIMLGFVCAVSFNALILEYEASLGALFVTLVATVSATEGHLVIRWARRKLPAPQMMQRAVR